MKYHNLVELVAKMEKNPDVSKLSSVYTHDITNDSPCRALLEDCWSLRLEFKNGTKEEIK
jgi:isochorismate hydrolase